MENQPSYYLIATINPPAPECAYCAVCSTCADSLGFNAAIHVLRSLGAVGIYGSTLGANSQTLNGLHCKLCAAPIPPVKCITSSEFSRSRGGQARILKLVGTSFSPANSHE